MASFSKKDSCLHDYSVKLRCGICVVNVKPLLSYDSKKIIIACGTDIRIFCTKSGENLHTMKFHTRPIVSLQESKENMQKLYSCSDDGVIAEWYTDGCIRKAYNLKMQVVNLYVPSANGEWFVTRQFEDHHRLYSLIPKEKGCSKLQMILKPVLPRENSIAFGLKGEYIASVHENNLTIYRSKVKNIIRHKTGDRKLTCVTCHPTDYVLATGDVHGRVIVWSNALESKHPIRSIYHWHSNLITDLAFSMEGCFLHSAGTEGALVQWNLLSEERSILPRLGASISYVVPAKDNSFIVTTHCDNVLQVIDSQGDILQAILGLTRSEVLYEKLLPAGLIYNSHLKTLVMNGKDGHLQFYDDKQEKLLFNLDIATSNYLSQERSTLVYNTIVQKAAFDDSGKWLATSEYWCNGRVSPYKMEVILLKFWKFDLETQNFTLNTNVRLYEELNCILFQPPNIYFKDLIAATTGQDGKIKIWMLNESKDGKLSWYRSDEGYYREMIPSSASFVEDGSILAVAFERYINLWHVDGLSLKAVMFSERMKNNIKQLLFGRHSCFKYLVCHDGSSIISWDCISLSIVWIVRYDVQLLVRDYATDNIAAFCKDQNLKIFKPSHPKPLDCVVKVSESAIVSGMFVPSDNTNNISGCFAEKSQLFFIDENQNLMTLSQSAEEEIDISKEHPIIQNFLAYKSFETPFQKLIAKQNISSIKESMSEQLSMPRVPKPGVLCCPTWLDVHAIFRAEMDEALYSGKKEEKEELTAKSKRKKEKRKAKEIEVQQEKDRNEKLSSIFTDDENWLSKALAEIEPKFVDFSYLAHMAEKMPVLASDV